MKLNKKELSLIFLATISVTAFGYSLGRYIQTDSLSPFFNYLFTPITTLAAAFGGSWYAFKLQDKKTKEESDKNDVKAANNTIFELTKWYNRLHNFKDQYYLEYINNPSRYFLIMPLVKIPFAYPNFDYGCLAFIFESKNPNLLGTLSQVEADIISTLDVILERSKMHLEKLQPTIEKIDEKGDCVITEEKIEEKFGVRQLKILKILTDNMISTVDDLLSKIPNHINSLKEITHTMYPGHMILEMIDNTNTTNTEKQKQIIK